VTCAVVLESAFLQILAAVVSYGYRVFLACSTHIKPGMCKLRYTTSEYIQETLSKIYYTLRTLYNHKTPQQPIFAETHFLKQPHTSRLYNTPY